MTRISAGSRSVVFNANVTGGQAIHRLVAFKTHSEEAIDTYMSFRAELCDLAAEVSFQSRRVPIDRFIDFVRAGDVADSRDRYAALRTAEILAYSAERVPSRPLPLPGTPELSGEKNRPLRPLEIGLVRLVARSRNFRKGTVNLAVLDAGGSAGDLPHMTPDRVETDGDVAVFHLPDTARSMARTVPIPDWAIPFVRSERRQAVADGRHDWSIGYKKYKTRTHDVVSAGLMTIKPILDHAGLRFDKTVTPSSIRNTRAFDVFTEYGIFEAARVLGCRSLDQAASAIGLQHA